jgi:hypothetical protein
MALTANPTPTGSDSGNARLGSIAHLSSASNLSISGVSTASLDFAHERYTQLSKEEASLATAQLP